MRTETVTCDQCGADLSTGAPPRYRLALRPEWVPPRPGPGGVVSLPVVHVSPPITRDCHFCGLSCLKKWAEGATGVNTGHRARYNEGRGRAGRS